MTATPDMLTPTATAAAPREAPPTSPADAVAAARRAQARWHATPLRQRLRIVRRLRHLIAERGTSLAERLTAAHPLRSEPAETLVTELLPLADACKFLERQAARLLRTKRYGARGRPAWLFGVASEVRRESHGVVLILGPSNYPLMLAGIQAVQALVAGNAVLLKPGRDSTVAATLLADLLGEAGLPPGMLHVLDESPDAGQAALDAGVDKVVLTGSAATGRAVLRTLAEHLTPATMELSGCDAVFVMNSADVAMVASAIAFGTRLNAGATCIAPRRIFAWPGVADVLEAQLRAAFSRMLPMPVSPPAADAAVAWITDAVAQGATCVGGARPSGDRLQPALVLGARPEMRLLREDVFAPVVSMVRVRDQDEALASAAACPYALGASIFGAPADAARLADRVNAGSVCINDLIVPTADPRLPFGGRGRSGFGLTRGGEGLLEMTRLKVVSRRAGSMRMHFDPLATDDGEWIAAYLAAAHGPGLITRWSAARRMLAALAKRKRHTTEQRHA